MIATPAVVTLSPSSESQLLAHVMRETSIATGAVLIPTGEMAKRTGCTERHLREMADSGIVHAVKDGIRYRFHLPSFLASGIKRKRKYKKRGGAK